jgi:hypothetical protein
MREQGDWTPVARAFADAGTDFAGVDLTTQLRLLAISVGIRPSM